MTSTWPDPSKTVEENNKDYVRIVMPAAVKRAHELMDVEQWREYFARLEGPEGCDFQESPTWSWQCGGGTDKSKSRSILFKMGLHEETINEALECVHSLGGHCDCEVLFNAAERIDP